MKLWIESMNVGDVTDIPPEYNLVGFEKEVKNVGVTENFILDMLKCMTVIPDNFIKQIFGKPVVSDSEWNEFEKKYGSTYPELMKKLRNKRNEIKPRVNPSDTSFHQGDERQREEERRRQREEEFRNSMKRFYGEL